MIIPCSIWSDDVNTKIREIRNAATSVPSRSRMIFVGATCWNMTPANLETIMNASKEDREFEFVGPDKLVKLTLEYLMPTGF